jgi:hypothetical protein
MRSKSIDRVLLLASVFGVFTACASQASDSTAKKVHGNDCVFFQSVYDWQGLDDSNLVIWAPSKRAYLVELSMPLVGLKSAFNLGFIDGTRDGRLCAFGRDAVTLGRDSIPLKSSIRGVTQLAAEDIGQLEDKYKVKLARDTKRKAPPKEPERSTAQ